jgi:hypothetical protein
VDGAALPAGADVVGQGAQGVSYQQSQAPGNIYTYESSGAFQFSTDGARHLMLGLMNTTVLNLGFQKLEFNVSNHGVDLYSESFTSLAEAQSFFSQHVLDLGILGAGMHDVAIHTVWNLEAQSGYAFDYALALMPVPEPQAWLMLGCGLLLFMLRGRRLLCGLRD